MAQYDVLIFYRSTTMGMFDQIRVTRTMPDGYQSSGWYQTKSLECSLTDYEIDDDGQLWQIGLGGTASPDDRQRLHHTGEIVFYDGMSKRYCALFDHGLLILLKQLIEQSHH